MDKCFPRQDDVLTIRIASLTLPPGEVALLTGASGSGKSTALALLGGAIRPSAAERLEICTNDGSVSLLDAWRARGERGLRTLHARDIGFVLQTGGLIPYLSLRDNIRESSRLAHFAGGARRCSDVDDLAARLSIADALDRLPAEVSVGQRQRAALARAVAHGPAIVLADEPTAALDFANADSVDLLLLQCVRDLGMAAVIATHRPDRPHWTGLPRLEHRLEQGPRGPVSVFAS